MTIETAIDALTTQTTTLLDTVVTLSDSIAQDIADAVTVSENATQLPLVEVARSIIDTQTAFITYIT
jgi:hypothetical protein